MFSIDVTDYWWVKNDGKDDPMDLCLHGHAVVRIGERVLEDDCTVSATALTLLKALEEDHIINTEIQMLPCCGFFWIPNEDFTEVTIDYCPNGTDWSIIHEGENIKFVLEDGYETTISFEEFKTEVFRFADSITDYYNSCIPKIVPKDDFNQIGYTVFWNEWSRRRNKRYR